MAYVYILRCVDDTLYTGYTVNMQKRLAVHNAGKGAKYTKMRLPVELVFSHEFAQKQQAQSAEVYIKRLSRKEKLALIAGVLQIEDVCKSKMK